MLWDIESVWHNLWPLNRSHWPLFHGPLILPNILGTIWWLLYSFEEVHGPVICFYLEAYLMLWDIESVWHNLWPLNRSHWPLFHGTLILPNILGTIWWLLYSFKEFHGPVICFYLEAYLMLWDIESVWHNLWPLNRSHWRVSVFLGPNHLDHWTLDRSK